MESDEIRAALREADLAEAAPWTEYPPTPWWYVPVASLWAGSLVLVLALSIRPLLLLLVAAELLFLAWYRRYRGLWPTGAAPRELRGPIWLCVTLMAVTAAAAWAAYLLAGPWWSAATTTVLTAGVLGWYERAYADAARRTRERLA